MSKNLTLSQFYFFLSSLVIDVAAIELVLKMRAQKKEKNRKKKKGNSVDRYEIEPLNIHPSIHLSIYRSSILVHPELTSRSVSDHRRNSSFIRSGRRASASFIHREPKESPPAQKYRPRAEIYARRGDKTHCRDLH